MERRTAGHRADWDTSRDRHLRQDDASRPTYGHEQPQTGPIFQEPWYPEPHSFDARWIGGRWTTDPYDWHRQDTLSVPAYQPATPTPAPVGEMYAPASPSTTGTIPVQRPMDLPAHTGAGSRSYTGSFPVVSPPTRPKPQFRSGPPMVRPVTDNGGGRLFFWILFWSALVTSVELWWLNTPPESIVSVSDIFIAVGRITGMIGGFVLLYQILMMSRVNWLERWVGGHNLLVWHRELGSYLLVAVLTHVAATIVGYAWAIDKSIPEETWSMITGMEDMISATVATLLMVAVAVLSFRTVRKLMSYETWHYIHLASYLVLLLGYGHQFAVGQELVDGGFAWWFWAGLYVFVVACLAWGRVIGPLIFNLRHQLRVEAVVPEGEDMVSIYIGGRRLDKIKVRAGQYFRWRFLTHGLWTQAHPFSLSAAPNSQWLRLTVKVVGDHTDELQFLEEGTRVFAEGPSGVFTAERSVKRRALLIAGGSGVAPVRALLEELPPGTIMLYRASSDTDLVFRHELDWLARERGAYVWYVIGSRNDPGPKHLFTPRGMRQLIPDVARRDIFLCGPQGLVNASLKTLKRLRVPRRQIHLDPFEF